MLNLRKQLTQLIEHMNQAVDDAYKRGYEKGKAESADSAYAEGYTNAESNFREMRDQVDQESYQRGLDDAWDAARKLALKPNHGGYSYAELHECFREMRSGFIALLADYTAAEVIEKIREYEERKAKEDAEIKVGDEVEYGKPGYVSRFIVTHINREVMRYSGISTYHENELSEIGKPCFCDYEFAKKTGRHVDLSELFGGENE